MATCSNGHKNPDSQRFCGECGAWIRRASERKAIAVKAKAEIESKLADFESGRISLAEFEEFLDGPDAALSKTATAATRSVPQGKADTRTRSPSPPSGQRPPGGAKKTLPSSTSATTPLSDWPPDAEPYYRPSLIAAIAASVGVMVGSVGPWATAMIFTVNGLDAGNWGVMGLTVGAVSCVALLTVLFWPRTPFSPRWAVSVAWAVAVAGVACVSSALPMLIRIMTSPKGKFFGVPIGPGVGWGLWLLAFSSAVMCIAVTIVATQIGQYIEALRPLGQSQTSWTNRWRWGAIIASAVIVISGVAYFSTHWENDSGGSDSSPTEMPSFPSFPSFPSLSPSSTPTSSP